VNSPEKSEQRYTVAFYNLENLFDYSQDRLTHDTDFIPNSQKKWTKKRYERKVYKLGSVMSKIGFEAIQKPPTLIGVAEAENKKVLQDLIDGSHLSQFNYGIVHYDSKDERGIDVGLLYNKDEFTLETSRKFSVYLEKEPGVQDFTRDILLVSGLLHNENIHCIINHWPSRREGLEISSLKRLEAAKKVIEIIELLKSKEPDPKIIVMGDFNDNPSNDSVKYLLGNTSLFNPMETLLSYTKGSVNHNFKWNLFDQILFTTNFFETTNGRLKFESAHIFDDQFLTHYKGKYRGQPFRTYVGKKYKGGFSDHFPVYLQISISN